MTSASYITQWVNHSFSKGHSSLFLQLHSYCFSFSAKNSVMAWQVGAHISHTAIADFKGIFTKYFIEFVNFWEITRN